MSATEKIGRWVTRRFRPPPSVNAFARSEREIGLVEAWVWGEIERRERSLRESLRSFYPRRSQESLKSYSLRIWALREKYRETVRYQRGNARANLVTPPRDYRRRVRALWLGNVTPNRTTKEGP